MTKDTFEKILKKYYLGGFIETTKISVLNNKLNISAITDAKNLNVRIEVDNFTELPDGEFGIHDTKKLIDLLKLLNETDENKLTFSQTKSEDGRITSISITDSKTEVKYATADLSIIQSAPKKVKSGLPDPNLAIIINKDLIEKISAACSALKDSEFLTLKSSNDGSACIVFGYGGTRNTTQVIISPSFKDEMKDIKNIVNFNAAIVKEIFTVNKSEQEAVWYINDELKFSSIEFKSPEYTVNYTLIGK